MDFLEKGLKKVKDVVSDKLLIKKKTVKSDKPMSPANEPALGPHGEVQVQIEAQAEPTNLNKAKTRKDFFDFLEKPGDYTKAVEHGLAQRVYKVMDDIDPNVQFECCECCGLILPKEGIVEEYPLFTPTSEMNNLGIGIYLYFFYMKFLLVVLLTVMGMYSIIEIITSYNTYNEVTAFCTQSKYRINFTCNDYGNRTNLFLFKYTYVNTEFYDNYTTLMMKRANSTSNLTLIQEKQYVDYSFLNFLMMAVIILINFIFCTLAYNINIERDIAKLSIDDYSAMISNLPLDCKSIDDIYEACTVDGIKPVDVVMAFKVSDYLKLRDEYGDIKRKIDYCESKKLETMPPVGCCGKEEFIGDLNQQLIDKTKEIDALLDKLKNHSFEENVFTGVALVSFETVKLTNQYISLFPESFLEYIWAYLKSIYYTVNIFDKSDGKVNQMKKIRYRVVKASEPNDINWENLEYSQLNRLVRYIIIYFLTSILIGAGFGIILGLNIAQGRIDYTKNPNLATGISIVISVIISAINIAIRMTLLKFTDIEKNDTNTNEYLSYAVKLTISSFLTSAVVPLVVNSISGNLKGKQDILISNIFIIFLSNAGVTPLMYLIPPDYLYQLWQRRSLRIEWEEKTEVTLTQGEMNTIFENPSIDIAEKFAYLGKTILMTFLFLPIFPYGAVISFLGIGLLFFVERYNLIRLYKIPEFLNSTIAMEYFYYFKIVLFVSGISSQIFLSGLFSKWSLACILCFCFTMFLPFEHYMTNYLEINEEDVVILKYDEVKVTFEDDYLRSNPITKQKGQEKFLQAKLDAGDITQEEFDKLRQALQQNNNNEEMFKLNYSSKKGKMSANHLEKYKKNLRKNNATVNALMQQRPNQFGGNTMYPNPQFNNYQNNNNLNQFQGYQNNQENNNLYLNQGNEQGYSQGFNQQGYMNPEYNNNQGYTQGYNNGYNNGNINNGYNQGFNQVYN